METYALKIHTAQTIADILVEQFVTLFFCRVIRSLHGDHGHHFQSTVMGDMNRQLRIYKSRTMLRNSKPDGLVEIIHIHMFAIPLKEAIKLVAAAIIMSHVSW